MSAWIKVEPGGTQPQAGDEVLVVIEGRFRRFQYVAAYQFYGGELNFNMNLPRECNGQVTHWKPLDPLPDEDQSK